MKRLLLTVFLVLATLCLPHVVSAADLTIEGLDGKKITLAAADIAALPQEEVSTLWRGETVLWKGPRLTALLSRVGAPSGEALRGKELDIVVVISASDGFRSATALSDTEASLQAAPVILAVTGNGKALDEDNAPYRLVIADDLRPSRSVRMVTGLKLVRVP